MAFRKSRLVVLFVSMFAALVFALPVFALPVSVTHSNSPTCDPLSLPPDVHELGHASTGFPVSESITTEPGTTILATCVFDQDPIAASTVTMTNTSGIDWTEVWYVSDPETGIANVDGLVNGEEAFRIDHSISNPGGVNHPLLFESIAFDGIFESGEIWHFAIVGYSNTFGLPSDAFDSAGAVGSLSAGDSLSSGSIIAVPVPESSTAALLALGLAGIAAGGRRKRD